MSHFKHLIESIHKANLDLAELSDESPVISVTRQPGLEEDTFDVTVWYSIYDADNRTEMTFVQTDGQLDLVELVAGKGGFSMEIFDGVHRPYDEISIDLVECFEDFVTTWKRYFSRKERLGA